MFCRQFPPNLLACFLHSKVVGLGEVWEDVLQPSALVPPSPAPVLSPFVQMFHVLAAQFFNAMVGRERINFTKVYKNEKETQHIAAGGELE